MTRKNKNVTIMVDDHLITLDVVFNSNIKITGGPNSFNLTTTDIETLRDLKRALDNMLANVDYQTYQRLHNA